MGLGEELGGGDATELGAEHGVDPRCVGRGSPGSLFRTVVRSLQEHDIQ